MAHIPNADTDQLLDAASAGRDSASEELLARHRPRLRKMIAVRMDDRLAARVDPSDVIQDAMAEAHRRLPKYLTDRSVAFYPWLRQIAWEKLVQLNRRHIYAQRRSVERESAHQLELPDQSAMELAERLAGSDASPSQQALRAELQQRIRSAIDNLSFTDREVITLRHLEELSFKETAAVLELGESAVQSRYHRAIKRLHRQLAEQGEVDL